MSTATVTLLLPTTRTDGTAFGTADYGGAHIFRDGAQIGSVAAPSLVFTDALPGPGTFTYTATVFDVQSPPAESGASVAVAVTVAAPLASPSAPTITVTVA